MNLLTVQGKLSASRKALVNGIFTQLDQDKDGFVSLEDIKGDLFISLSYIIAAYNPGKHPDVIAGSAKAQQVKIEFLDSLESYANYLVIIIELNNSVVPLRWKIKRTRIRRLLHLHWIPNPK